MAVIDLGFPMESKNTMLCTRTMVDNPHAGIYTK